MAKSWKTSLPSHCQTTELFDQELRRNTKTQCACTTILHSKSTHWYKRRSLGTTNTKTQLRKYLAIFDVMIRFQVVTSEIHHVAVGDAPSATQVTIVIKRQKLRLQNATTPTELWRRLPNTKTSRSPIGLYSYCYLLAFQHSVGVEQLQLAQCWCRQA